MQFGEEKSKYKKPGRRCPTVSQLGNSVQSLSDVSSNQCIFKGMYDNVFNSDVCYPNGMCDKRSVALPSENVTCKNNRDSVTVVYNSKCQKENDKALFSRGNKRRLLTQGRQVKTHVPHIHRASCVPNNTDRGYGVTVSTQPPMLVMSMIFLKKWFTRSCQANQQLKVLTLKYTH